VIQRAQVASFYDNYNYIEAKYRDQHERYTKLQETAVSTDDYDDIKQERDTLKTECTALKYDVEDVREDVEKLKRENSDLRFELNEAKVKIDKDARSRVDMKQVDEVQRENSMIKREIKDARSRINKQKDTIYSLDDKISRLKDDLKDRDSDVSRYRRKLDDKEESFISKDRQAERAELEVKDLRSKLLEHKKRIDALEKLLEKYKDIESTKGHMDALNELSAVRKKVIQLEKQNNLLALQLKNKNTTVVDFTKDNDRDVNANFIAPEKPKPVATPPKIKSWVPRDDIWGNGYPYSNMNTAANGWNNGPACNNFTTMNFGQKRPGPMNAAACVSTIGGGSSFKTAPASLTIPAKKPKVDDSQADAWQPLSDGSDDEIDTNSDKKPSASSSAMKGVLKTQNNTKEGQIKQTSNCLPETFNKLFNDEKQSDTSVMIQSTQSTKPASRSAARETDGEDGTEPF